MRSRAGLVLVLWLALAGAAQAAVIPVTRTDDRVGGTCTPSGCTLREAIAAAAPGDTVLLGGTPTAPLVHDVTRGELVVDKVLTIEGGGAEVSGIDGASNPHRILRVEPTTGDLTLRNVSLTRGHTAFEGSNPLTVPGGHAIFNAGRLTVRDAVFENNGNSSSVGGAISNTGTLAVVDTDFRANSAGFGGAIDSRAGTVTITGSTIRNGSGTSGGAAIHLRGGQMEITSSTIADNGSFGPAGGIFNRGGALTLASTTLANNVNASLRTDAGATTTARNTIFGRGFNATCTVGAITNVVGSTGNLDEDGSCGGASGEARLAPLADNGGATPTMALLHGSAAIDATTGCPASDQRGAARFGACDIGAF